MTWTFQTKFQTKRGDVRGAGVFDGGAASLGAAAGPPLVPLLERNLGAALGVAL